MIIEFFQIFNQSNTFTLNLSNRYIYTFNDNILKIKSNNDYVENLYGDNIVNINALIGENGAGKTSLIKSFLQVLSDEKNLNFYYLILYREGNSLFFSSNIKRQIVANFKMDRKPISYISKSLKTFFYSNVFDANNIFKSTSRIKNISTNAIIEESFPYNFSLNAYSKKQNDTQVLFTILNRESLEIDNYIKIPESVFLHLNSSNIYSTIDEIFTEFRELGINLVSKEEENFSLQDRYYKILSYNYYLEIVKWIDDFIFVINTDGFNNIGRIVFKDNLFEDFWRNIEASLEVLSSKEADDLKRSIKTIMLIKIEDFIGDKYILLTSIKSSIKKLKRKFNLKDFTWNLINSEIDSFILSQLDSSLNISEDEVEEVKKSLLYLKIDANRLRKKFKNWLNKRIKKYEFENFLEELKVEFSILIDEYSEFHDLEFNIPLEDSYIGDMDSYEEIYINDILEENLKDLKEVDKKEAELFGITYSEDLINVFENYLNKISEHLFSLKNLLANSSQVNELLNNKLEIETKSKEVYEYFNKYKDEDLFELSWRNLSSGELSFLVFLSRFYQVSRSLKKSSHILMVIDEGDLYFHPQWQKKYIDILIKAFNHIFPENKMQIILTSHSPFIISDLPQYAIELISKKKSREDIEEALGRKSTFAANIQDLYSSAFFLEGGLTGEYSKKIINEAINNITNFPEDAYKNQVRYYKIFQLIGEPLVRNKCIQLLNDSIRKTDVSIEKRTELQILRERIKILESQI